MHLSCALFLVLLTILLYSFVFIFALVSFIAPALLTLVRYIFFVIMFSILSSIAYFYLMVIFIILSYLSLLGVILSLFIVFSFDSSIYFNILFNVASLCFLCGLLFLVHHRTCMSFLFLFIYLLYFLLRSMLLFSPSCSYF